MDAAASDRTSTGWLDALAEGSDMGALVADFDWSATPLGPPASWPTSLRIAVGICLGSRFPMLVTWGPDLTKIYNDGYARILGPDKHPRALGAPVREIWPEVWDTVEPLFLDTLAGGTTYLEHQPLDIHRNGFLEECYFTFCYSPLPTDDGSVAGVLDVVTETTEEVVNRRRLVCVSRLAAALVTAADVTEVAQRAVAALRTDEIDVADVELHLQVGDQVVRLATTHRATGDAISEAALVDLLAGGQPRLLDDDWVPGKPAHRWASPIGATGAGGVLVVDLNPKRPFDDGYRAFLELIASTIGAAADHAQARSAELGEQRRISDALQGAMLLPAADLPTVAARYVPATGNLSVGGDWYDVISLPDGRRALVVGDCVGHGLAAATAMGQLRSASRWMLLDGRGPADLLASMDRFAASVPGAPCTTMVCAIVDLPARTLTYASAGHPSALLVGADGARWLDDAGGLPLAVGVEERPRREAVATFEHDDLLVLYTDGLVERRGEGIDVGFGRLEAAATERRDQSVQELADGILHDLLDPEGRDDIALVVKRLAAPPT